MTSENDDEEKLKSLLKSLKLGRYIDNFIEEDIIISDLKEMLESDVEELIPKAIHRRRFMNYVKSLKGKGKTESFSDEPEKKATCKNAQLLVKWGKFIEKVYDVPLDYSNERLIGKLLQAFVKCEVKLHGEEKVLAKELKSFTLKNWCDEREGSADEIIRAVLSVKGDVLQTTSQERSDIEDELREEIEKLKNNNIIEMKKKEEELIKEKAERKRGEIAAKEKEKKLSAENAKLRAEMKEMKKKAAVQVPKVSMRSERGIIVPNPETFKFIENNCSGEIKLSKDNKVATKISENVKCTFITNYICQTGLKYYFQVKAKVVTTGWSVVQMGVMKKGGVKKNTSLYMLAGWAYDLGIVLSSGYTASQGSWKLNDYGPIPRPGNSTIGMLVDFSGKGKGKISFIVDGKNYGVAFDDVEPPVCPAFSLYKKGEYFELCQNYDVPVVL